MAGSLRWTAARAWARQGRPQRGAKAHRSPALWYGAAVAPFWGRLF
eukprot:COSAG01_NODE_1888_length_8979_cov_78.343806_11_plen_46_part_00